MARVIRITRNSSKFVVTSAGGKVLGANVDDEFCKERARTVRALAMQADPFIKKRLLQLAAHYERRIQLLEEAPEEAPRPSISERQN